MSTNFSDKEYAGITGVADFCKASIKLAYGNSLKEATAVTQTLSGTGALRIGGDFLARFYEAGDKKIFLPTPTWGNHGNIFKDSGLQVGAYKYFSKETNGLDLKGMLADLKAMPAKSVVLLHACAHNPTGVDPTISEWQEILNAIGEREHQVFFDMAYQGFASGLPDKDAAAVRMFVDAGIPIILAQSYAKNFGLYGERVGALSIVCSDMKQKEAVESQLKIIVRPMYSNPPIHGARIVSTILNTPELNQEWLGEVKMMADRIIEMRTRLFDGIVKLGNKRDWSHIKNQIGMFCYTGLNAAQVERLTKEFHVYLTKDGRISIAGITPSNVDHLAKAMHEVSK